MTVVLTDLQYEQHTHTLGEEHAHFDCHFKVSGRPVTITVAVQAALVASSWFSLVDFLENACCERVKGWYDEPADVYWG